MLLRLPKDAYPLSPNLLAPKNAAKKKAANYEQLDLDVTVAETAQGAEESVKIFPLPKK